MKLRLLIVCLGLALHVPSLQGQSPRQVTGFWAGGGLGGGSGGFDCEGCADLRTGPVGSLIVGRTFSSRLALAAEVSGWWDRADASTDHLGHLSLKTVLFPASRSGWHLMGGLGLARGGSRLNRGEGGEWDRSVATGIGWSLGTGYDFRVGSELALAPFVAYFQGASAELKINGFATGERVSHKVLAAGVGLYWNFSGAIGFPAPTPRR